MRKVNNNTRKSTKKTPRKYNLGSLVEGNQELFDNMNNQMANLMAQKPGSGAVGQGAMSGLNAGSSIGSLIPGGTIIGAGVGLLGGALFGSRRRRKARRQHRAQVNALDEARSNTVQDLYESSIDVDNENPYGVYEKGGDIYINPKNKGKFTKSAKSAGMGVQEFAGHVLANKDNYSPTQVKRANFARNAAKWKHEDGGEVLPNIDPVINIEKGELQIDTNTGKILRKYDGINPETGGFYEPHAKKGKDSRHNMVTAEEGTFIITKKEAKKYEDAVKNNDKLYQNSIMSNIRNHKRSVSGKYQDGSFVLEPLTGRTYNPNPNVDAPTPTNPFGNIPRVNIGSYANDPIDVSSAIQTGASFIPSIYNMIEGSKSPNYMPFTPTRMNVASRQRILANMPNEISANPALRSVRSARSRYGRNIDRNTSNASIARANRLAAESTFMDHENEALYRTDLLNNQIRSQRASILSGLDAQDREMDARNVASLNNTMMTNRQMDEGRRQQFNYGISQVGQMAGAMKTNKQKREMDEYRLDILSAIAPALSAYYSELLKGGKNAKK